MIGTKWHDHGTAGAVVVRHQYVGDIVEQCKALHNEGRHGGADFKLVAKIPLVVVEHYCNTHGVSFKEFNKNPDHMARIVNDPAFADLRVAPGRI